MIQYKNETFLCFGHQWFFSTRRNHKSFRDIYILNDHILRRFAYELSLHICLLLTVIFVLTGNKRDDSSKFIEKQMLGSSASLASFSKCCFSRSLQKCFRWSQWLMIERPTTEINHNLSLIQIKKMMKRDHGTN